MSIQRYRVTIFHKVDDWGMYGYTSTKAIPTVDGEYVKFEDVAHLLERERVGYKVIFPAGHCMFLEHEDDTRDYEHIDGIEIVPVYA